MKLNEALLWVESQNMDDTDCLITKQPIINKIQLRCGHIFEYDETNMEINKLIDQIEDYEYVHSDIYQACLNNLPIKIKG